MFLGSFSLAAIPSQAQEMNTNYSRQSHIWEFLDERNLKSIMSQQNYDVSIDEDNDIFWRTDGYKTYIRILDKGHTLLYFVKFTNEDVSFKQVNTWNSKAKFSRSYLTEKSVVFEMGINLEGGITHNRLLSFLESCNKTMKKWKKNVVD